MGPTAEVFGVPEVSMRAPGVGKLGLEGDEMCQRDAKRKGGSIPIAYTSVLPFFKTLEVNILQPLPVLAKINVLVCTGFCSAARWIQKVGTGSSCSL